MMKTMTPLILLLGSALASGSSYASVSPAPACLGSGGQEIPSDDSVVMQWKSTTPNQTLKRAHVTGVLTAVYPDRNGHNHFSIRIGTTSSDTLEVVYSQSFGALTQVHVGMAVEACGDYITSNAATAQYPASPDGAIIHWIHKNPSGHGHPSGFLMLDGQVFGQGAGQGGG